MTIENSAKDIDSRKMAEEGAPKAEKKQPKCQSTVLERQKLIKSSQKKRGY